MSKRIRTGLMFLICLTMIFTQFLTAFSYVGEIAGGTPDSAIEDIQAAEPESDQQVTDPAEPAVSEPDKQEEKTEAATETTDKSDGEAAGETEAAETETKDEGKSKVDDPEPQNDSTEEADDNSDAVDINMPAFDQTEKIGKAEVNVKAEEGVFPEGAKLSVEEADAKDIKDINKAVDEVRDDNTNVGASYTFDIKVIDKDGNEIQPADDKKVEVTFKLDEADDTNLNASVYHLTETKKGLKAEELKSDTVKDSVSTETESFSFYTVEFTYGNLQYVMEGDSSVALSDILDEVGLKGEASAVEVSNDKLFSAEKKSGKWMVTAHKAFKSEEWMKVTIDGIAYEITVTDEDWLHYSIDLYWKIADPSQKYEQKVVTAASGALQPTYTLTIQTSSVNYEPESMEIRLPLYIFHKREGSVDRNGKPVVYDEMDVAPSDISVPEYPNKNDTYKFSYYIDEDTKELVFINNSFIPAGWNESIQVEYTVNPYVVVDLDTASFQAKAKATPADEEAGSYEEEERVSPTITYQLDTGLESINPGKEEMTSGTGFEPVKIEDGYRYYKVNISPTARANQPYYIYTSFDFDGTNGEIVGPIENFENGTTMTLEEAKTYYTFPPIVQKGATSGIAEGYPLSGINTNINGSTVYVRYKDDGNETEDRLKIHFDALAADNDTHEPPADMNDKLSADVRCYYTWPHYPDKPRGIWYKNPVGQERQRVEFLQVQPWTGIGRNGYEYQGPARFTIGVEDEHVIFTEAGNKGKLVITDTGLESKYREVPNDSPYLEYEISGVYLPVLRSGKVRLYDEETQMIVNYDQAKDGLWYESIVIEGSVDGKNWVEVKVPDNIKDRLLGNGEADLHEKLISDLWVGKGYRQFRVTFNGVKENIVIDGDIVGFYVHGTKPTIEYLQRTELDQYTNWADIGIYNSDNKLEYSAKDWGMLTLTPLMDSGWTNLYKSVDQIENDSLHTCVYADFRVGSQIYYTLNSNRQGRAMIQTTETAEIGYELMQLIPEYFEDKKHLDDMDSLVLYDLLPMGYRYVDLLPYENYRNKDQKPSYFRVNSLEERYLTPSVEIIDNYKGTFRQMVVFRFDLSEIQETLDDLEQIMTALEYRLFYRTVISWDDLVYYQNENNLLAQQRGDGKEMFSGKADNGEPTSTYSANLSVFKEVMGNDGHYAFYDLNGNDDDKELNTTYSYATVSPNVVMSAATGIEKHIMGDSGKWTDLDHTDINKEYYYRVRVSNGDTTHVKDLIIYDTLEEAANTQLESGEVTWKGSFKSIDVSSIEDHGYAPVVYYSTADPEKLDYNLVTGREDEVWIDDTSLWSTELPDDPSTVTAVAVDIRKMKDGSDAVFDQNQCVEFFITMTAPPEYPTLKDPNMVYAINRPAYHSYQYVDYDTDGEYYTDIGRRVKIYLEPRGTLTVKKLFENQENDPEFTVEGPNGFKDTFRYSDMTDGEYVIEDLAMGEYKIYESFSDPDKAFTVSFDGASNKTETSGDDGERVISADVELSYDLDDFDAGDFRKTVTITNTSKNIDIAGIKLWDDEEDRQGMRPSSITVNLLADGKKVDTAEVSADDDGEWGFYFEDVPKYNANGKEIKYTIEEEAVDFYNEPVIEGNAEDGFIITNKLEYYTEEETSGTKTWLDNNDELGLRPENIRIKLMVDGEMVDDVIVSEDNDWQYTFGELPKYFEGEEIEYTIEEDPVDGYISNVNGFDVTNICQGTKPTTVEDVKFVKKWDDNDNSEGKRPESIVIRLYADGVEVDKLTISEADSWKGKFTNLPVEDADGNEINYDFEEDAVSGYKLSNISLDGDSIVITNKYIKTGGSGADTGADTGDNAPIAALAGAVAVCAIALAAVIIRRRRNS